MTQVGTLEELNNSTYTRIRYKNNKDIFRGSTNFWEFLGLELNESLSDSLKKTISYYNFFNEFKTNCSIDVIHLSVDKLRTEFPFLTYILQNSPLMKLACLKNICYTVSFYLFYIISHLFLYR